ncbi:MAG: M6 family metalloprotease domain-containing protein, partial [Mucinivorans sp.]
AFLGSCQRGVDFNSANVQRQANIQSMLGSEASRSEQQQAPNLATKGLVILVNFSDVPFSVSAPNNAFTNMLNQKGYSRNGATGSAKDYFKATSFGKYNPDFTVVGPVNIPGTMKFYGENNTSKQDINAAQMVVDACNEADKAGVNFADYDSNNDGQVDNVFIYYAGYNEAEYGGENTIWPHKSNIISRNLQLDGKYIGPYACSSEYKGAGTGKVMAGIGTFCHEFGHVLGLMDMYDTEYNGNRGLDKLSIMSMGGYNNGGNTPPLWNALERQTTGWGEYAVFNDQSSKVSLAPINISNQGYMIPTSTRGEYFVIEVRDCTVPGTWDYWIDVNHQAKGLVIYQVDQSFNMVGGMFASQRWSSNRINTVLGHECMRMLLPETYYFKPIDAFWPTSSVKSFIRDGREPARDWNRKPLPYELTDITLDKDIVSFNVKSVGQTATITGIVLSEDGTPLAGASVSLRATPILNKGGQILSAVSLSSPLSRSPLGEQYTTITDVNGNFSLKDIVQGPYDLVISEYRHITYVQTVNLQKESEYLGEFTLVLVQQKLMKEVSRSNGATDGYFTISNVSSGAVVSVSNYWTAENIAADTLTKDVIRAIAFQTYQSMNVEGKVFFDDVLAFTGRTQSTTSGRTIIGVDGGLNIPAGKSMRIAFSFTPLKDGAVVAMDGGAVVKGGNLYSLDKGVTWSEQVGGGNFVVSYLRDKGSDEMSKANIRGQAFQREAFVEWFSLDANVREWSIQLAQKGQPSQDITYKGGQSLSIVGLTPG